jgi:hypothetical protein
MSKTILADVDGFTPVIDSIVKDTSLITANVFGRIWRYCQMKDGVCKASLRVIGEGLGLDATTILTHAKILCNKGYLIDLTPSLRNHPHTYADTGKAGISVKVFSNSVEQDNTAGVEENNASVEENNTGVDLDKLKIVNKSSKTHARESLSEDAYKARIKKSLADGAKQADTRLDGFPRELHELARAWMDCWTKAPLTEGQRRQWVKELELYRRAKIDPALLSIAFMEHERAGLSIKSPQSIYYLAEKKARKQNRNTPPPVKADDKF